MKKKIQGSERRNFLKASGATLLASSLGANVLAHSTSPFFNDNGDFDSDGRYFSWPLRKII